MKLSIITINLNNKSGLEKTLNSIKSQTFKDFEWIVIDGASEDGSQKLILQNSNFIDKWVSEHDSGIYNAMNKGIKIAKGDYLLFLNSGDCLISSNTLETVFQNQFCSDIVYGNVIHSGSNQKVFKPHCDDVTLYDVIFVGISHQASFIKKNLFESLGLYDETYKLVSDQVFFIDAVLQQRTFRYLDIDISYYDPCGMSSGGSKYHKLHVEEKKDMLSKRLPKAVIQDYNNLFKQNEVLRYKISKRIFGLLYRCVTFYEKLKYN